VRKVGVNKQLGEFLRQPREKINPDTRRIPATPACIIGARYDILCWNRAATDLFGDFEAIPIGQRNVLFQTFVNQEIRKKHPDWADDAQRLLESFRSAYDLWSDEPEFTSLVDELSALSPEFKKWWNAHQVRRSSSGEKIVRHPKISARFDLLGPKAGG